MVRSLQAGDDVLTSAGIYGSIVDLDDEVVTLQVADGVRLRVARMAIGRRLTAHAGGIGSDDETSGPDGGDPDRTLLPPPMDEQ